MIPETWAAPVHGILEAIALTVGFAYYRLLRSRSGAPSVVSGSEFAVAAGCIFGAALGNKLVFWIEVPHLLPAHWYQLSAWLGGQSMVGGLLGGLMGGGAADQMSFGGGSGGASLPFAGTLAEKLGISEQMANMLIMGAIGLLTSSMAKNRSSGEVDYQRVADPEFIRSSGVAGRLSSQMGISEDEAILGLQQTMGLMVPGAPAQPAPAAAKKPRAKKTTTKKAATGTPKKAKKKKSESDFMDLLDDTAH